MATSPLADFDRAACAAAAQVIARYSTSFSLATRLLREPVRTDIRNLYAVVRIADEIVDTKDHSLPASAAATALDAYEAAVRSAATVRFHTDPVLHAFGLSARRCGFRDEHLAAFFSSMRTDLTRSTHTAASLEAYIFGSAEVIGLLCLDAFLSGQTSPHRAEMESGARRLGAAFQKINFLRDLAEDTDDLGRAYFPQLADGPLTDAAKADIVADIRCDLAAARATIGYLPRSSRAGVAAATALFSDLTDRLDALPAADIYSTRVSVPAARKAALITGSLKDSQPWLKIM